MKKAAVILVVIAMLFPACGNIKPSPEDLGSAYYGEKPVNTEKLVREFLEDKLKDPYTAKIKCYEPRKGWVNQLGQLSYGWITYCDVNAKNSFGGYTGVEHYHYLFHGDKIVQNVWATEGYLED